MSQAKSLTKITNKYHCIVSGEKLMTPCDECTNTKGCLSRGMQYKENEDLMDETAVVKISSDGKLQACAKGLPAGQCGYKVGADVCGACGATAVTAKMKPSMAMEMDDDEMMDEDMEKYAMPSKKKRKGMGTPMQGAPMMDDEEEDDEEAMVMPPKKMPKKPQTPMMMIEDDEDDEDDEEYDEEAEKMMMDRMRMRNRRMATMGLKSADFDENAFVCAFERKVYPGASGVCENCPGGCAPEGNLPGLLEVEGIAEDMFSGKVLESGYSDEADIYVIDIERKDGKAIEAFFEGSTAECLGWHLLDSDLMSQKSLQDNASSVINFSEAAEIAVKAIDGHVIGVDPDIFEGFDSYAVEIEGKDGKSYDVYVSLDGELLGYDEYTADEAAEIEAEAAEIALKRAYSEDARQAMARSGHALPDGSYPIKDEADLRNAIQAYGRAKDKEAAKAHIIKRAMTLGKEDLIPENWVPKKIKEQFEGGKKDAGDEFLANLMEFELLAAEEESRDLLDNN